MANIEKIELDTKSIAEELKQAKNLTESERVTKSEALKTQLKSMNDELHAHLSTLNSKTDAQSTNERSKTEELLGQMNTMNDELLTLGADVQSKNITTQTQEATTVTEHRKKIWSKDERKENATGNLARLGAVAGAVTGVTWLWNKVSGWFGGGKNSSKKESSRWGKILKGIGIVGGSALALTGGSQLRNKLKERMPDLFGPELNFEDSFKKAKADLHDFSEKNLDSGAKMDRKEIGEGKVTLTSYTQTIEINTKEKTIPGLNVKFKSFSELIHAANLANFCKGTFRGRCTNNEPFNVSDRGGGDMDVDLVEDKNHEFMSGQGVPMGKILGTLSAGGIMYLTRGKLGIKGNLATLAACVMAGHFGLDRNDTLSKYCPALSGDVGKKSFLSYLNGMGIWQKGSDSQDAVKESPISKEVEELREEIKNTPAIKPEHDNKSNERNLNATVDPLNPNKIIITSYGTKSINIFYDQETQSIQVEGLQTHFQNTKEGIRVANITNMLKYTYTSECNTEQPFWYGKGLKGKGLYVENKWLDDKAFSETGIKKFTPTLYKDIKTYIQFLNSLKNDKNVSLWKKT